MQKLWLKFKDEDGTENRVEVYRDVFTIGRHSDCSLVYRDSRLSREHLRIERDGGEFTASDPGSSNGTTVNGQKLDTPRALKDGDVLDLGGGLQVAVEVEATLDAAPAPAADMGLAPGAMASTPAAPAFPAAVPSASPPGGAGIPVRFFIFAPLLAILVLAVVVGAVVLFGRGGEEDPANSDDIAYSSEDEDGPSRRDDPDNGDDDREPAKSATPAAPGMPVNSSGPGVSSSPAVTPDDISLPGDLEEVKKVERNAAAFLKLIAVKDSNPFLTGEQARRVNARIKQVSRLPSLAENLRSARSGAAQIKSTAAEKNLNPYFLAVAAITHLGGRRGSVAESVNSIVGIYDNLAIPVGTRLADDVLLMVAAYDQGVAGENLRLRDTIANLARGDNAPSPREIRTIWYLEKAGKLTPAEFDRALTFLALGTIAQNPKEFGVNTEALRL